MRKKFDIFGIPFAQRVAGFFSQIGETIDKGFNLSVCVEGHPMDAIQELEDPTEGRCGCRQPDLIGEGFPLSF